MREMRIEMEMKLSDADLTLRATFTHLIEEDTDVRALGLQDREATLEYARGYGSQVG